MPIVSNIPNLDNLKKRKAIIIACFFVIFFAISGIRKNSEAMPEGTDFSSKSFVTKSENVKFYYDLSYLKNGEEVREQKIFDLILKRINGAKNYILVDAFLFNSLADKDAKTYRPISGELTAALIAKKKADPAIKIDFICDPINTVYGGSASPELNALRANGVNVIVTDLGRLRNSNLFYSPVWQVLAGWTGNSAEHGWIRNPFGDNGSKVTLRSLLSLLNFKANHRKIFIADDGKSMRTIISSANPHDGSSAHSNAAIEIQGDFWQGAWLSESAAAKLSNGKLQSPPVFPAENTDNDGDFNVSSSLLTENQIEQALENGIRQTSGGDEINIAVFYLSDRDIIKALLEAAERGVKMKIVLDPNKDAFGYRKIGIPNREAAAELVRKSENKIQIRWYDTHGEQFHTKLAYIAHKDGPTRIIAGSANFTRRNLDNFNLESDIQVIAPSSTILVQNVKSYFERIWNNENGNEFTVGYESYKDDSLVKYWIYRIQEATGLSSF